MDKYPLNPARSRSARERRKGKVPIKGGEVQHKRGVQKNWERILREEQERENCNSWVDIRAFSFQPNSLYLRKIVCLSINSLLVPRHFLISCLDLPLWKFYPVVYIN